LRFTITPGMHEARHSLRVFKSFMETAYTIAFKCPQNQNSKLLKLEGLVILPGGRYAMRVLVVLASLTAIASARPGVSGDSYAPPPPSGGGGGGGGGGGYAAPAPAPQYGAPAQAPVIHKHVYVHVPPPEPSYTQPRRPQAPLPPPQKHYKIVFIKAPTPPTPTVPEIALPPPDEQKTLIYVLVKKPEEAPEINIPTPAPTTPSKPEVYFIRYKTQKQEGYAPSQPSSGYGAPAAPAAPSAPGSSYGAVLTSFGTMNLLGSI
ncbi:hypothetical protein L9F63_025662, partial [Diploptera punctata]